MTVMSQQEVLELLEELIQDLREHPEKWENATLDRYLEGMRAWLTDVGDEWQAHVDTKGMPWSLIGALLCAAKVYE
jgi:hypothetical protein